MFYRKYCGLRKKGELTLDVTINFTDQAWEAGNFHAVALFTCWCSLKIICESYNP